MYQDLLDADINNVKIIAIGKSEYASANEDWINGNSIPIVIDLPNDTTWTAFEASQRDLFFLDAEGNYFTHFNISSWDYDNIYNTIIGLLHADDILGCTDSMACNYNSDAMTDDGSCAYAEENHDCEGNCLLNVDCADQCGGLAIIDMCGICDDDSSNDCVQDCAGTWDGDLVEDECGICGGDNSACVDCAGVIYGDSVDLGCGCGVTPILCYLDLDGDGYHNDTDIACHNCNSLGSYWTNTSIGEEIYGCTIPDRCNYNPNATECNPPWCDEPDCGMNETCFWYCADEYWNDQQSDEYGYWEDCNGYCFGYAIIDDCGVCSDVNILGQTGHATNSDMDCVGDCFGSAIIDDCGVCSGGNTDIAANSDKDCNGDCFGIAIIDNCGECSGGNTGIATNSDMDCVGDCFGSAIIDDCGVCAGGNSGHIENWDQVGCGCFNEVCLGFDNIDGTSGTLDIIYSSNSPISGFQFNVSGISNISAAEYGNEHVNIYTDPNSSLVVGFTFGSTPISAGEGVLASLTFDPENIDRDACLSGAISAFDGGVQYSTSYLLECINIQACDNSDECGVCGGNNSQCSDECGVPFGDGWSCAPYGDVNLDYAVNVIDIVMIVDFIFYQDQFPLTENQFLSADVNEDTYLDIQDIIMILGYIHGSLGRETNIVKDLDIYQSTDGLYIETDGFIGLDITISHDPSFRFTLTEETFLASFKTENNITRMIIVDPTSDMLFETEDKFEIEDIKVVSKDGQDVNINIILMPTEFTLSPAYPNPFNPTTTLSFALPKESNVSIVIYNLQGREVESLINNGNMQAGYHSIIWNANHHVSGLYFVQMIAGNYVNTQKLMLVK